MDNEEASQLLRVYLDGYRRRSYEELVALLDHPQDAEIRGTSGVDYYIQVQVFWNRHPGEDVRVLASINDGGWRAFVPLTDDFIMAPTGRFVGE
jgi:hypothetical protein